MENRVFGLKGTLFMCFLLVLKSGFSQSFDWFSDGYNWGGLFKNIDKSGIDVRISGLYGVYRYGPDSNAIVTGINNQVSAGITHTYYFNFSELVDVEFTILGIDRDSARGACYNDELLFLPSPIFSKSSFVKINGDTVFPLKQPQRRWGEVTVKYTKINNFSIRHGKGIGCNPGYIIISALRIRSDKGPYLMHNVADNSISIGGLISQVRKVYVVNTIGQLIQPHYEIQSSDSITIETLHLTPGVYFVLIEFESGQTLKQKFIVVHG